MMAKLCRYKYSCLKIDQDLSLVAGSKQLPVAPWSGPGRKARKNPRLFVTELAATEGGPGAGRLPRSHAWA